MWAQVLLVNKFYNRLTEYHHQKVHVKRLPGIPPADSGNHANGTTLGSGNPSDPRADTRKLTFHDSFSTDLQVVERAG